MSFDNTFSIGSLPTGCVDAATGLPVLSRSPSTPIASDSNAALFANLFAWALKYGAYNIHTLYQVSSTASNLAYPSDFSPRVPSHKPDGGLPSLRGGLFLMAS